MKDLNGYLAAVTYPTASTVVVTDAAGRQLTFTFRPDGRVDHVTDPANRTVSYGYNDGQGNLTDVTDILRGNWHWTYDAAHRVTTVRDPRQATAQNPAVLEPQDRQRPPAAS